MRVIAALLGGSPNGDSAAHAARAAPCAPASRRWQTHPSAWRIYADHDFFRQTRIRLAAGRGAFCPAFRAGAHSCLGGLRRAGNRLRDRISRRQIPVAIALGIDDQEPSWRAIRRRSGARRPQGARPGGPRPESPARADGRWSQTDLRSPGKSRGRRNFRCRKLRDLDQTHRRHIACQGRRAVAVGRPGAMQNEDSQGLPGGGAYAGRSPGQRRRPLRRRSQLANFDQRR
ncbi:MAG: hypothetical protein BWZ10_00544 [candidate division BRC1 bacterium ADurb.BinA364]|nr:MAG: hypothetical protein BWZ10_00544 [candidate division BRC1 bacterium ADurb.BinA364]